MLNRYTRHKLHISLCMFETVCCCLRRPRITLNLRLILDSCGDLKPRVVYFSGGGHLFSSRIRLLSAGEYQPLVINQETR